MHISGSEISKIFWGWTPRPPVPLLQTGIYDCTGQLYTDASAYRPRRYRLLQIILTTLQPHGRIRKIIEPPAPLSPVDLFIFAVVVSFPVLLQNILLWNILFIFMILFANSCTETCTSGYKILKILTRDHGREEKERGNRQLSLCEGSIESEEHNNQRRRMKLFKQVMDFLMNSQFLTDIEEDSLVMSCRGFLVVSVMPSFPSN